MQMVIFPSFTETSFCRCRLFFIFFALLDMKRSFKILNDLLPSECQVLTVGRCFHLICSNLCVVGRGSGLFH